MPDRYPYCSGGRSASKIGSRISTAAIIERVIVAVGIGRTRRRAAAHAREFGAIEQRVIVRPAVKAVIAQRAVQTVCADAAIKRIRPVFAVHRVIACITVHAVGSIAPHQTVRAIISEKRIVTRISQYRVASRTAVQAVLAFATHKTVIVRPAIDKVIAGTGVYRLGTGDGGKREGSLLCIDDVAIDTVIAITAEDRVLPVTRFNGIGASTS